MTEEEKKFKEAAEKAAAMAQNPSVMFEAFKMTHMAYAFQFAMTAKPQFVIAHEAALQERLNTLHEGKNLVMSVSPFQSGSGTSGYLIFFYGKG